MGDKSAQIKRVLRDIVGADPNHPITGTVLAVDGRSCTVRLTSGLEVSDVRLTATLSDDSDVVELTPAIGSDVVMLSSDGSLRSLMVVKFDRLEKVKLKMGTMELEIAQDGKLAYKNGGVSLADVFAQLKATLTGFTVNTADGPSTGLAPQTTLAVSQFETMFKQLLK